MTPSFKDLTRAIETHAALLIVCGSLTIAINLFFVASYNLAIGWQAQRLTALEGKAAEIKFVVCRGADEARAFAKEAIRTQQAIRRLLGSVQKRGSLSLFDENGEDLTLESTAVAFADNMAQYAKDADELCRYTR